MTPVTSMVQTQKNLEELFDKNQLMDVLREQFAPLAEDNEFWLDCLCYIYLHKQADVPVMTGLLSPKWGEPQDVAEMLIEAIEADIMDFDLDNYRFIVKHKIPQSVQDLLDRYQFPLPMVVRPGKVRNNCSGSGYYNRKGRIILNGSDVFDEEDVCLDHINRVNSVALTLNTNVISSAEGKMILPKRKPGEPFMEFRKRQKQAEIFYNTSLEVIQGMLMLGNKFWLTHKYDRRGRTYCVGYHINSQGTEYNKAVLELARKEVIR